MNDVNASATELDLDFVRSQFPAFADPALDGQSFFENAGGSFACRQVIDRLIHFYRHTKVQPYYPYAASEAAGRAMDESCPALARYLNVDADEICIGPSTTLNTYVLANASLGYLKSGDEIVVTDQDHEANGGAWRRLSERGIVVREWQVDPDSGSLKRNGLAALLNKRTRLVAFSHCSNIIGEFNPVAECCRLAHDAGAMTVVDGVSYAGHGLPDIAALGADVYLFSTYKTYGPHQGVMVVRRAVADRFSNQGHYFNADQWSKRLTPAGPDHAQVAAVAGIGEYFDTLGAHHFGAAATPGRVRALLHAAEHKRLARLMPFLDAHPKIRIVGPRTAHGRAPTVSLIAAGHDPEALTVALAGKGIMSGWGHFYAARLLDALGIDNATGVNRFSFVHYTSDEDIDRLIGALDETLD